MLPLNPAQLNAVADLMDAPGATCNNCPISGQCPKFLAGAECALPLGSGLSLRDPDNALVLRALIADKMVGRGLRAAMVEEALHPGLPDPGVSNLLVTAFDLAAKVAQDRAPRVSSQGGASRSVTFTEQLSGPPAEKPSMLLQAINGLVAARSPSLPQGGAAEPLTLEAEALRVEPSGD